MADECRPVEIDGEIVRVRGEREMDDTDRAALAEVIVAAKRLLSQQPSSKKRSWPDWRTADPGKAIEHVR